ncbi:MAG: 4-hydroxyphenylacetate decarboxylase small subunit [Chloroflexi bacterium]|nr:4-hydroxyphenylacetate decarboxylase small subunit [Chloroflexota bacterium]
MIEEKTVVQVLQHSDCRNFCSMDVAKGICRRTQDVVLIDAEACSSYAQLPKCKFCANFAAGEEGLGTCLAEANQPWAYPEMIAVTCEMYKPA